MSELIDRARDAMAVCICHGDNDNPNMEIPMALVSELIEAVEFLEQAADHWKSLWQGTVEYSTKVIQERDEALREVERLQIREVLAVTYLPEGVDLWMCTPNRHLNNATPQDLIASGRGDEVLSAAKRIEGR